MITFQELQSGGEYYMTTRYANTYYHVRTYSHPHELDNAIIIEYLDTHSKMALYRDQFERGLCRFSRTQPPQSVRDIRYFEVNQNRRQDRNYILFVIVYIIFLVIIYIHRNEHSSKNLK
jgi:predicted MPP superfamily phosphohydrolase